MLFSHLCVMILRVNSDGQTGNKPATLRCHAAVLPPFKGFLILTGFWQIRQEKIGKIGKFASWAWIRKTQLISIVLFTIGNGKSSKRRVAVANTQWEGTLRFRSHWLSVQQKLVQNPFEIRSFAVTQWERAVILKDERFLLLSQNIYWQDMII